MTETIWLVIFAIVSFALIYFGRNFYNTHHTAPLTSSQEAFARVVLMILSALIAHLIFSSNYSRLQFWLAVATNGLVLYALSHLADRWLLRSRV